MKLNYSKLGDYIKESKLKNKDSIETNLVGLSNEKQFTDSKANIIGTDLSKYKLITYNQFVYMPTTSRNGDKISIALFKEEGGIISSSYTVFDVDFNLLNPDYLMLWFERPEFDRYARYHSHGSVREIFSWEDMQNIELYVPPLEYQNKVVKIKNLIDNRIAILTRLNKNLEEQLSLLFNDWFVNCTPFKNEELIKSEWGVVPESWKDIEFGELIEITSGNRPDEKSEDKTSEFNIPLFGASKIMGYTKEYSYNEDILIIGRVGTHGVVQRVNYPCFPSDNTFVIKSDYYGFVYQLLKRIDYDSLNTGSTQPLITQKSLKSVNTILPDEKILSKFEMISKTIFDKIQLNNDEISNLTKLRDTLLPKLMSGEIDVSKINCDLDVAYS